MTGVPLLAGLVSIAAAIGLGVYLLAGRRVVPAGATALDGDAAGRPSRQRFGRRKAARPTAASADEAYELPSVLRRFGGIAARLTPSEFAGRMQRRLDLAGNPPTWSPERLMAFKGLGLVTGVVLGFLGALGAGFVLELVVALALGAAGLFLPDVLVKNIGDKRQTKLQQQLPDAMDMLTVCVEAGLGFDAALARVARNTHGAVAEECARVLQ
jgi:tight adherence protein C